MHKINQGRFTNTCVCVRECASAVVCKVYDCKESQTMSYNKVHTPESHLFTQTTRRVGCNRRHLVLRSSEHTGFSE